jgi:large subunit ribosomal protein L10
MPNPTKETKISEIQQLVSDAKALVFADYRGLSATKLEELRHSINQAGGKFFVIKNTLLKIALRRSGYNIPDDSVLDGPTAVLFSDPELVDTFKTLHTFSKDNELPTVKGGYLQSNVISPVEFNQIANLPALEVLQAKLVGNLNAPIYNLVYVLKGNINQLVYALKALQDKKSKATEGVSSV